MNLENPLDKRSMFCKNNEVDNEVDNDVVYNMKNLINYEFLINKKIKYKLYAR